MGLTGRSSKGEKEIVNSFLIFTPSIINMGSLLELGLTNCSLDLLSELPLNFMRDFKKFCNDLHENEELRKQFVSLSVC